MMHSEDTVREALEFAKTAHEGQMRKYRKEPYIEHPKRVAEIVKTVPHTREMICAAYLHDVVEDTSVTIEDIGKKFGNKVAALVGELTDEFVKKKYPHLNRKMRKERETSRQAHISVAAKTIKLADVIDNTPDISKNDRRFARRYIPEMEALVKVLYNGDATLFARAQEVVVQAQLAINN